MQNGTWLPATKKHSNGRRDSWVLIRLKVSFSLSQSEVSVRLSQTNNLFQLILLPRRIILISKADKLKVRLWSLGSHIIQRDANNKPMGAQANVWVCFACVALSLGSSANCAYTFHAWIIELLHHVVWCERNYSRTSSLDINVSLASISTNLINNITI